MKKQIVALLDGYVVNRMQFEGTVMMNNRQCVSSDKTLIYHALVDILPDALCVTDMDQKIILVNKKAVGFIGERCEDDFIGKSLLNYIAPEDHKNVIESIHRNLERGFARKTEYSLIRKDGTRFPVEVITTFVVDENGTPIAMVCLAKNISETKKIRKLHVATAKRATLLADLMKHDIANQLQIMMSTTELLMHLKNVPSIKLLRTNMASILKCLEIISVSEDMENLSTAPLLVRSLNLTLGSILGTLLERFDDATFDVSLKAKDAYIQADIFLERLLLNILENAYEHNPKEKKCIWVRLSEHRSGYLITIGDDGPGIPSGMKKHLRNPIDRHCGIGLQFSRNILEKYGGLIEFFDRIEGHPEQGTEVRMWIPHADMHIR